MNLIEIKDLTKSYGKKGALKNISLTIEPGKIYGLLGKNGACKSTLIKVINDLLIPDSGEILYKEEKIGPISKEHIAYLPERTYLNMNFKVKELLDYFEDFYENFDRKKALNLLKKLNINPEDKLKTMSKGTKEKVQLILVMSRKADLYILDEPIGGVDPASRDYILETILSNFDNKASMIISTHLIQDIESILDNVIFINQGKIILNETADDIRTERNQTIDQVFREEFKC